MNDAYDLRSLFGDFEPLAASASVRAEVGARLDTLIADAVPRQRKAGRRRILGRRQVSVVALAGALLVSAAWTVADFHFTPFSGDPAPLTTASVRSWLQANYAEAQASIVPATVSAVGTFSTPRGNTTVYTGRSADGRSFVAAYVRGGQVVTAIGMSEEDLRPTGTGVAPIKLSANYLSPDDFGRVWQIWGTVPAGVARVELRDGDGTTTPVPLHEGVFLTLRPADCDPPAALVALDAAGNVVERTTDLQVGNGC
jgi:hypothetical protein